MSNFYQTEEIFHWTEGIFTGQCLRSGKFGKDWQCNHGKYFASIVNVKKLIPGIDYQVIMTCGQIGQTKIVAVFLLYFKNVPS